MLCSDRPFYNTSSKSHDITWVLHNNILQSPHLAKYSSYNCSMRLSGARIVQDDRWHISCINCVIIWRFWCVQQLWSWWIRRGHQFLTQAPVMVHRQLTLALVLMMLEHILDLDELGDPHAPSADDHPPVPHCSLRSPCMIAQWLAQWLASTFLQ